MSEESKIKPGDVVHLRSGSHPMTVESVVTGTATVLWALPDGSQLVQESVEVVCLEARETFVERLNKFRAALQDTYHSASSPEPVRQKAIELQTLLFTLFPEVA